MPRPRRPDDATAAPVQATGSTARGEQRRERLVMAACALLEEGGFEVVGHRAVAARARLPLAATTYYFTTLDDLIDAAMHRLGGAYLEQARALMLRLPAPPQSHSTVAALIVSLVAGAPDRTDPARLLTFYERYVQAGRHPRLRPMVRGWTAELGRLVEQVLDRYGYAAAEDLSGQLVAMTDGLLLDALIDGDAAAPARAAAGVARLLARLREPGISAS